MVAAPDGANLYALNGESTPGITVINTTSNQITATINLPASVQPPQNNSIEISPDGQRLYIANRGIASVGATQFAGSGILVYDIARRAEVATIPAPAATTPFEGVAVSPDGLLLYAWVVGGLRVIDTVTHTISATIATGSVISTVRFANSTLSSMVISPGGETIIAWEEPGIANRTAILKTFDTRTLTVMPDRDMGVVAPGHLAFGP